MASLNIYSIIIKIILQPTLINASSKRLKILGILWRDHVTQNKKM